MADNIKIIGNILSTTTVSRYDIKDINLIQSKNLKENFGGKDEYIEFYIYDAANNLLNINYNYLNYKLPSSTGLTPGTTSTPNTTGSIQTENVGVVSTLSSTTGSLYPIIEIDPVQDLQNIGYSSGEFNVRYNLFKNIFSDYINKALFIKEISPDRTEVRLGSTTLTDAEIEQTTLALIDEINNADYYVDYLLNFGSNEQYIAVNVALNKAPDGYEVLFKLYQPLPLSVQEKQTLWVVEEKTLPYVFDINLDKFIIPSPLGLLRGPNFDISIPNQGTISTTYTNYSNAITSLQALQNSSYNQILNLMNTQSIQINVDYTDFDNFVFFGSSYQRVSNFYTKVKQIEDYTNFINYYTPYVATTASLQTQINQISLSINNIISQFDGYESYLYFESSSYTWPKSGSYKPYSLLSTGSATVINWYNALVDSAKDYDNINYDNLEYAVPTFIKDDGNNKQYLVFLNMVGQYFDNIWIYLKAITDINLANNNLNKGISKDLVYNQLQSLGIKLYNSQAGESVDQFLIGANTGSSTWDNNTTITGSYLNNIPRKDLLAELYKRIYHNLPLLLKTKGTKTGLEHLITTFGIPSKTYISGSAVSSSILDVKEFGGSLKTNLVKGYNDEKVRIISNSITGSVLSPLLSLQTYPVSSTAFRDSDMNYVDISFSPETQIDTYTSKSIASNDSTWVLDDYIGDPRQQYSSSYPDLDIQRQLYYQTGVSGFPGFTGSLMDYNGFIRLIQFFDNSLFKMLGDFVPERTSLSTGVTINSPVLERNKAVYSVPFVNTQSIQEADYQISSITSQYGDLYNNLSGDKKPFFTGELSGSVVDIHDQFEEKNYNPYLYNWDVWNNSHSTTQSINTNYFLHSDFNVLLNNVSSSIKSDVRQHIEYTENLLPTQSLTSSAELQDSYLTLRSYNISRYEGSKLTSLLYNTYTTSSYTGSDGFTIQNGDISYGKTAAVDRQSYKVAWVKNIPSQSLNFPDKTQIQLKYLVDKDQNLTDLTLKNNNLFEVQNTFKSSDKVVLSLSDAIKPSFQKTLDGTKLIFRGGYSFDPIFYREARDILKFRWSEPRLLRLSTAGILAHDINWVNGYAIGMIFNNRQAGISTWPSDIPITSDQQKGWIWYKNYGGAERLPMASTAVDQTTFRNAFPTLQNQNHTKFDLFNVNGSATHNAKYTKGVFQNYIIFYVGGTELSNNRSTANSIMSKYTWYNSPQKLGPNSSRVVDCGDREDLPKYYGVNGSPGKWTWRTDLGAYNFGFGENMRNCFIFDNIFKFNDYSDPTGRSYIATGGYNHELTDITNGGKFIYVVPRSSQYRIKGGFPVSIRIAYFDYVDGTTGRAFNDRNNGYSYIERYYTSIYCGVEDATRNIGGSTADSSNVKFLSSWPYHCTKWYGGGVIDTPGYDRTSQMHYPGVTFRIYATLERSSNADSVSPQWDYITSTRIKRADFYGKAGVCDPNNNIIHFCGDQGSGVWDHADWGWNGITFSGDLVFTDDNNSNIDYIDTFLNEGDSLRIRFFVLDFDCFFHYGRDFNIEIGKPDLSYNANGGTFSYSSTGLSQPNINRTLTPYISIEDTLSTFPVYEEVFSVSGSTIFSTSGSNIIFSDEMYQAFTTSSIFEPTAPTSNNYSPIIDPMSIQPGDIIRIGSFNTSNNQYYDVIKTELALPSGYTSTNSLQTRANFLASAEWPVRNTINNVSQGNASSERRSIIQVPFYDSAGGYSFQTFFNNIFNSISKQFIIYSPQQLTGITYTIERQPQMSIATDIIQTTVVVGTSTFTSTNYRYYNILNIAVSPDYTITPTTPLFSTQGGGFSWNPNAILPNGTSLPLGGIQTLFQSLTTSVTQKYTVTLDRDIKILSGTDPSQFFAVLRPKPDETSVIINFKKSLGDVSQTILIPQDANDDIKNNVGNIFQSLNVDLSN
jgi:hypothetical protein